MEVFWYGLKQQSIDIKGRPAIAWKAFTRKEEAEQLVKEYVGMRYMRIKKRLSMPDMRGRGDYVWVVYTDVSAIKPTRNRRK